MTEPWHKLPIREMRPDYFYSWIKCADCGAKYYYKGTWSNSHSCPKCGVSHEDHYNCRVIGGRFNPKKYVYPQFKEGSR